MSSQRRVRHTLRLALLVTLSVLAMSACGVGGQEEANKPRPLPEDQKPLRTGVYRSEEFKPALSFRLGEGWATSPPEVPDSLKIVRGETAGVRFVSAQAVYKPGMLEVVEAPKDLVGWFQHHPYLKTDKPKPARVGEGKGKQFDVVVEDLPRDYYGACGSDCVDIFRSSGAGWIALKEGDMGHVIVLEDVNGETVTIGIASMASDFDEFAPEAQKVIDSVRWSDS